MNRIQNIFKQLLKAGEKTLIPYISCGDPSMAVTEGLLPVLQDKGVKICELGVPFSDPIADGPVIQASMTYALDEQGVAPGDILEMVARQREKLDMGIVVMVSYSIVYRLGDSSFLKDAASSGIDGFIIPDLPVEEADQVRDTIAKEGLSCSFLIAPSTSDERARKLAEASSGFVYVISLAGITGERKSLPPELGARVKHLREVTDLPMAVGFGVSNAEHVAQVVEVADAAIVGSAIVRRMQGDRGVDTQAAIKHAGDFVGELTVGLSGKCV